MGGKAARGLAVPPKTRCISRVVKEERITHAVCVLASPASGLRVSLVGQAHAAGGLLRACAARQRRA